MEQKKLDSDHPRLRSIVGALIFGAPEPLTAKSLHGILREVEGADEPAQGEGPLFAGISEKDVAGVIDELRRDLEDRPTGIQLVEIAEGYRFFTDPACAPWMRRVLQADKPARLSRPSLETLAIVAYRQPVTRSEIEGVRGVSVDHVVRNLMELQLVRIVGRSELPGRPLLYGTTHRFLEHFGIKDLRELPGIDELARRDRESAQAPSQASSQNDAAPDSGDEAHDEPSPQHDRKTAVISEDANEAG